MRCTSAHLPTHSPALCRSCPTPKLLLKRMEGNRFRSIGPLVATRRPAPDGVLGIPLDRPYPRAASWKIRSPESLGLGRCLGRAGVGGLITVDSSGSRLVG